MNQVKLFLACVCCLFLTSCTGLKNIQDLTYIVAIGMDFDVDKKEYTVYLQGLDFADVAKQEGGRPVEPAPIFLASATGETLNLAISKLYKVSEPPLFFGHTNVLLVTEKLVKHKFKELIEEIGRNRSLRPTLRVIVTKDPLEETLSTNALFSYPAVYTILFKKNSDELAQNEIRPMVLMDFLREFYEPMGVARIPTVKIDQNSWKAEKEYPVLYFDGYAIFQQQEYVTTLPFEDAQFINWLLEKSVTLDQKVEKDGELIAAVKLVSPKMKIKYDPGSLSPTFSIELAIQADLLEKIKDIPLDNLTKLIEDSLKKKITSLYSVGIQNKIDILNAGVKWYRKNPMKFQELKQSKTFYLDDHSLKDVKVNVQIIHSNNYKYDQRGNGGY